MVGGAGCQGMLLPGWRQPGSAAYQQAMAELFDPFPEDEVGQEIVGVRPREYQDPIPEPLRGRRLPWGRTGR